MKDSWNMFVMAGTLPATITKEITTVISGFSPGPGGRRAIDADDLDLQNAFLDFIMPLSEGMKVTTRIGRQELLFGKQRLVSPLDWANTRRTFDAVRGILSAGSVNVHGFWSRPVRVEKSGFNTADDATQFFGVYTTGTLPVVKAGFDVYWLTVRHDQATVNGTSGAERRHSVGARVGGKLPHATIDYDVEYAYQFGTLGSGNISAHMIGSQFGYTFSAVPTAPRLHVGFDYGSGDAADGGDVGTASQLFPLGHAYLGFIDMVGRQNVVAFRTGVALSPARGTSVAVTGHSFARANDGDALYHAGAGVLRAPVPAASKSIGRELDVTMKYPVGRYVVGVVGYSRFFAGQFLEDTGASQDISFFHTSLQFTF